MQAERILDHSVLRVDRVASHRHIPTQLEATMGLPFPGIGVVFDIDDLGGGFYGYEAWKIFMKHLDPSKLTGSTLLEGDTMETLNGGANEFCIAVYGSVDVDYVRSAFEDLTEEGLAPPDRRFIEKPQLDSEPLPDRGRVDSEGFFVTGSWTRVDHDLCKGTGWGFRPGSAPNDLPPELAEELEALRRGGVSEISEDSVAVEKEVEAASEDEDVAVEDEAVEAEPEAEATPDDAPVQKAWWQFWK
ncbi:hypothetical protein ACGF5M_03025 [Gemmatimonadota bacterium]